MRQVHATAIWRRTYDPLVLEAQRRHLAEMHEACGHAPADHPHQLAALERERALAAGAADVRGYLRSSGNLVELARAQTLDAAWNRLRVAQAVEDPWLERAAAEEYVAVVEQWPDLPAPEPAASPGDLFTRALLLALEVRIGGAADADEHLAGAIAELHASEPGFTGAAPEYARRVPWRWLPDWIAPGPGGSRPPVADVRAARREWAARLGGPAAGAEPAAVDPAAPPPPTPAESARLAQAPLRGRCEQALRRRAQWPDPLLERHHRGLLVALDAARTPTQVQLAATHADACLAVEADWNALLHAALVAPVRAMCGTADPRRAAAVATELLAVDPRALARTRELLARCADLAAEPDLAFGAERGEAGFELLRDLRDHLAAGGAPPGLPDAREPFPIGLPERPMPGREPRL